MRTTLSNIVPASLATLLGLSAAASAQPNIEVRIENVVRASATPFEFLQTELGQQTPQVVVVRNIGNQDLLFDSPPIFAAGGFTDQFELVQPPLEVGDKLSPNGSTAFLVRFKPTLPRSPLFTTIFIPTNDPDTAIYSLPVNGTVPLPQAEFSANGALIAPNSQVNAPTTPVGQVSTVTVEIANIGQRPLTLTAPIDVSGGFGSDAFSVNQPAGTIQPGDSVTFAIAFAPLTTGARTAQIGVSTNDVGQFPNGRMLFVVRGVATAADCDGDGASDAQEIAAGAPDCNANSIPDSCESDTDGDGLIDACDAFPNDATNGAGPDGDVEDDHDGGQNDDGNADDENGIDEDGETDADNADGSEVADEAAEVLPSGIACGFGAGLAPLGCIAALAGRKRPARRRSR